MLGKEPESHRVLPTSWEVWERGPRSVHILFSDLNEGMPEGRGKAPKEIRDTTVLEKLLYRIRCHASCVRAHSFIEQLLCARPCVWHWDEQESSYFHGT